MGGVAFRSRLRRAVRRHLAADQHDAVVRTDELTMSVTSTGLALDPGSRLERMESTIVYGVKSLPITFQAEARAAQEGVPHRAGLLVAGGVAAAVSVLVAGGVAAAVSVLFSLPVGLITPRSSPTGRRAAARAPAGNACASANSAKCCSATTRTTSSFRTRS